ncbi:MAG TPA: cytidine deaminase [Eubacteriaceae bacterium]|jgi:cytidine deaminase|nr:cytidine deaminase [Eubacteriaceae bacterium]
MDELKNYQELLKVAFNSMDHAYAPYSNFKVGSAVLMEDGEIYSGCNIENASYGASNCAERTAIFKGISKGNRIIKAIAIVGSNEEETFPCGICRQVINEFNKEAKIILTNSKKEIKVYTLEELLPHGFSRQDFLEE